VRGGGCQAPGQLPKGNCQIMNDPDARVNANRQYVMVMKPSVLPVAGPRPRVEGEASLESTSANNCRNKVL
jgi:hypothetical protein